MTETRGSIALIKIVGDSTFPKGNRGYAAMGVRNFGHSLTLAQRTAARFALERLITQYGNGLSPTVITLMSELDGTEFVHETVESAPQ